jgi:16S rRNA (uracil1498-N3)-methyltransferase
VIDLTSWDPGHHRFFASPEELDSDSLEFSPAEGRHLRASLRLRPGDLVRATDGRGRVVEAELTDLSPAIKARVLRRWTESPPDPRITVFQGIVKPARMEVLVEKLTELGVEAIVPLRTRRSVRDISPTRLGRLRRIAVEALKQSQGAFLPDISQPAGLEESVLRAGDLDAGLLARREASESLAGSVPGGARSVGVWVGPEGGFSPEESEILARRGCRSYHLGPRRLRAETAALATVAALLNC